MLNCAFETELKINSHDCDYNGVLRPSGYMRYLQECANLQVESGGFGYDDCLKKNCAFILSRVSLSVHQPLFPGDRVLCRTAPCQSKGVTFYRNSELYKNGRPVAELLPVGRLYRFQTKNCSPWKRPDCPSRPSPSKRRMFPCGSGFRRIWPSGTLAPFMWATAFATGIDT